MRAAKIDANQSAIVAALRAVGASVQSLAGVGNGVPDLLVWWRGYHLLEVKDGSLPPSDRELTQPQKKWHAHWGGPVHVVLSEEDALRAIGVME